LVPFVGAAVFDGVFLWVHVAEDFLTIVLSEIIGILGIAGLREEDGFVFSDATESFVDFVISGVVAIFAGKDA